MSTRSMTRPVGGLGYTAEVIVGSGEEGAPGQKVLVDFPLGDITRQTVTSAFQSAWPVMKGQILKDMPQIVEAARPEIQKEATRAGIYAGGIAALAVLTTAAIVWSMR